ncbi:MAG: hypothetical protein PHW73_05490 [Atribacterota bacterium]|nr:hypothetical protein [Atribacterota bacterium]
MNRHWTVDTCVLYDFVGGNYDAFYFLHGITIKNDKVVLDQEKHIETEYQNCMKKIKFENKFACDFISKWFTTVVSRCVIKYCGDLDIRHKKALKKLNFHDKDLPFVAVCKQTKDKNLVSKDSDYNNEVKEYLLEKMEVHVLSIQDSLNFYK